MQSLRILDRFSPSEAYLLTLLAAHHLEMIREEQLLAYLDRGMGIANRDARAALLESALLRAEEIDELEHFLSRKVERGPRDFRSICRSMHTPSVEWVWRHTRNDEARRLVSEAQLSTPQLQTAGSGGNGSGTIVATDSDDDTPHDSPRPQKHALIKAAVVIGLLLMVALAAVMPMDRVQPGMPPESPAGAADDLVPGPNNMVGLVRVLYLILEHQDAVVAQLTKDPNLTPAQRSEALKLAKNDLAVSFLLNNAPWYVLRTPGHSKLVYERCLALATEASVILPDDGMILNTLGVAQYRTGKYEEALKSLRKSFELNKNMIDGEQPADVAFLCMTYARLGRMEEAAEQFSMLKELMKLRFWQSQPECQAMSKEAASVMEAARATKI